MRAFQILLLALLASLGARECAALPETHPGDILLPTLDGRVVLFHPEKGAWEDYASLGNYMFPTDIAREASGDFLICDDYASVQVWRADQQYAQPNPLLPQLAH